MLVLKEVLIIKSHFYLIFALKRNVLTVICRTSFCSKKI